MTEKNEMRIDNDPDEINLKKLKKKIKKNPWIVSTVLLSIISIILIYSIFSGGMTKSISSNVASTKFLDFASAYGANAEIVEVVDMGDFFEIIYSIDGQEGPFYLTKEGNYFMQTSPIPLTIIDESPDSSAQTQQAPQEITKSDKPVVELFVMTHCPYGTQAEKGILPVFELLGDKIDGSIKFVHYFMHEPEEAETPLQICIREEQPSKYIDYLTCFLEDGDSDKCLKEAKIDETKLDICVESNSDKYYGEDSELSQEYGVSGSPTLIINGEMVNSGRSPEAYLATICSAFNDAPEECSEELNSASPSPGFGYTASAGGSTSAQC